MTLSLWLLFCAVALLTAFSPGPAVLLAVTNATALGMRKALLSSAGNAAGVFVVATIAMLGLGALLKTSVWLFGSLKIVGATYLIYLGIRQWRSRLPLFDQPAASTVIARERTPGALFLQGLLVAATNPKSILFFTALLPQFMTPHMSALPQFFALTITFATCTVVSHICYVVMARGMSRWLAHETRARWFNRIVGAVFATLGIGVLRLRNSTS